MRAENGNASRRRISRTQSGFSLIEVMVSMVILVVGLVSLLGVFGVAMASTQTSQLNGTAKQLANEAIESILTARETANVTWTQIQNTGAGGIFVGGFVPINCAGVDGIVGTVDDAGAALENVHHLFPLTRRHFAARHGLRHLLGRPVDVLSRFDRWYTHAQGSVPA